MTKMISSIGGANFTRPQILFNLPSVIKGRSKFIAAFLVFIYTAAYFTWIQTISYTTIGLSLKETFISPECDENERKVLILLWTKLFGLENVIHDGTETFYFDANNNVDGLFARCPTPTNRCRLTNNQSLIEQSEAVIFNAPDITEKWPVFRSPHQRWIFFNVETPLRTNSKELKNLSSQFWFNWTLTYRRDSDVVIPYGPSTANEYQRRLDLEVNAGGVNPTSLSAIIKNKKKLAAWVVSHCAAENGRDDYVNELKNYITVDVYGKCSSMKCDNKTSDIENFNPPLGCYKMVERDYKFYLAFENGICPDYVTEKFYNALLFSTVPIVYGGADYEAIGVPPNSYIDVRNFASAQHLANYLHYLDKNDTAYRSYFDWRLKLPGLASLRPVQPWCNLCQKLLTKDKVDGVTKSNEPSSPDDLSFTRNSYDDIYSWWFVKDPCQTVPIEPF